MAKPIEKKIFLEATQVNTLSIILKEKLLRLIAKKAEEANQHVVNPAKDFTRKRKLPFHEVVRILLSIGGNSLGAELLEYFEYRADSATSSAFVQQRGKMKSSALESLFHEFTGSLRMHKTFDGYRLLAFDGTDLNIAHNPEDTETYFQSTPDSKGFNQFHLNALYDLRSKLYEDVLIQHGREENEYRALTDLVDRSATLEDTIILADRGLESYNVFAHIEQKGWNYVIRVKDVHSNGILSGLTLPLSEEFDVDIHRILTRKQTNDVKAQPTTYKFIPSITTFDYLDLKKNLFYPMSFRVVRIKLSDTVYETLITNLSRDDFGVKKLKSLYHLRWGIETSFRELKYAMGLSNFHSKKRDSIRQEVFAKLIMYNFCEQITMHVVIMQKKPTKHFYQVNFTIAMHICVRFFRGSPKLSPLDLDALIRRFILPVRDGRADPRKIRPKTAVSFLYRVA